MVGVSGSGKSTFANTLSNEFDSVRVETDAIRLELTGNESDQSKNGLVFSVARQRVEKFLDEGKNVIFDATNLTVKDRKEFISIGKKFDCQIRAYVIKPDLSVSKARNESRHRKVPSDVIDRQNTKFVIPSLVEGFDQVKIVCV